jgi:hypothetical protein
MANAKILALNSTNLGAGAALEYACGPNIRFFYHAIYVLEDITLLTLTSTAQVRLDLGYFACL